MLWKRCQPGGSQGGKVNGIELIPGRSCRWVQSEAVTETSSLGTSTVGRGSEDLNTWRPQVWPAQLSPEAQRTEQNY